MAELNNNRWLPGVEDFATRVEVSDLTGFFSQSLTIEPGTLAMMLENGQSIGEVHPGQYTLKTLGDKLAFWSRKSISAILTRESEVFIELNCESLPTQEFLQVDVVVRLGVRIDDVALFQKNLLGSKPSLSMTDLQAILLPITRQALWETVGRLSIRDLTSQQARGDLELCVTQSLGTSLLRNGLRFTQVQTLSVAHPEYDKQQRRIGQIWLQRADREHDQSAAELAADKLLDSVRQQERTNDIEVLAEQVASDRMEADLAVRVRRIGIRKSLRDAIMAEQFDELTTDQKLAAFQQQQDTEQLLREDEYNSLVEVIRDRGTDRQALRAQLLRRLDIEQRAELDALRVDLDHAQSLKTRGHEIQLAELADSEESRKWKSRLQRETEEAEHRRRESLKQIESDRQHSLTLAADGREQELLDLQHRQQVDRITGDVQLLQVQQEQRVALLQTEIRQLRDTADDEIKRRRAETQRQIDRNQSLDQLERLRQIQQMNVDVAKHEAELRQSERRLEVELDTLRDDKSSQRELAKLQAMRGMSDLELIATSDKAAILADVVKNRDTEKTSQEIARSQLGAAQLSDAKLEEIRNRLADAEKLAGERLAAQQRQDADRTIELMREMLQGQHAAFGQFGTNLENVTRNLGPQPQVAPPPAASQHPPASTPPGSTTTTTTTTTSLPPSDSR
ncbi:MAG TPA: hypothetical protein DDZ51_09650 [Planctomycetaceae bacterium]|nr:hypothetical protein [Planctomycetaceae bacterium]